MAERHHARHKAADDDTEKDPMARDKRGEKKRPVGKIQQLDQKMIYCGDDNCRYYHELYFDTRMKKYVMPDGHYCSNGDWCAHEDNNETKDMLVQKPSATPEGKDLREAFGRSSPEINEKEAEEEATAH
jgi:hypothetical protein